MADIGYITYEAIRSVTALILAKAYLGLAERQLDIAKKYYGFYEKQRRFYFDTFQKPLEKLAIDKVNEAGIGYFTQYVPDYGTPASAISNRVLDFSINLFGSVDGFLSSYGRKSRRYRVWKIPANFEYIERLKCLVSTDTKTHFFRYEDHKENIFNERLWNRRLAIADLSLKRAGAIKGNLASSFESLNTFQDQASDFYAVRANTIMYDVGASVGRRKTNSKYNEYLNRPENAIPGPYQSAYSSGFSMVGNINIANRGPF